MAVSVTRRHSLAFLLLFRKDSLCMKSPKDPLKLPQIYTPGLAEVPRDCSYQLRAPTGRYVSLKSNCPTSVLTILYLSVPWCLDITNKGHCPQAHCSDSSLAHQLEQREDVLKVDAISVH
ncbi:hypothetical protein F5Y19DRAFT_48147 [Xylariaceae sp. FL1651]|nr:hypothetical protein F5Y19DRAFT_48147 [Xylariaceae sp. FL1651]